jgi:hypothetical protein
MKESIMIDQRLLKKSNIHIIFFNALKEI